jgi:hypothetical protein
MLGACSVVLSTCIRLLYRVPTDKRKNLLHDALPVALAIWPRGGPIRKHRFQQFSIVVSRVRCRVNVFIGCSLGTIVSSGSIVQVFQLQCHNIHLQLLTYASWLILVRVVFKTAPQKYQGILDPGICVPTVP